ncbi:MAG: hypothetical protein R3A47_10880 [Polyangiales bacterium]
MLQTLSVGCAYSGDATSDVALSTAFVVGDVDNDGIADEVDVDDDNDGIFDEDEGCYPSEPGPTFTSKGFDLVAIQAGWHGVLYKLAKGGYAITGMYGKADGTDALSLQKISVENGYARADEIAIGTYGGRLGGGVFILNNGDYAIQGVASSVASIPVGPGPHGSYPWTIYTSAANHPGFPPTVSSVADIAAFRCTSNGGSGLLTMLDTSGNLYYNGAAGDPDFQQSLSTQIECVPGFARRRDGGAVLSRNAPLYDIAKHRIRIRVRRQFYTLGEKCCCRERDQSADEQYMGRNDFADRCGRSPRPNCNQRHHLLCIGRGRHSVHCRMERWRCGSWGRAIGNRQ